MYVVGMEFLLELNPLRERVMRWLTHPRGFTFVSSFSAEPAASCIAFHILRRFASVGIGASPEGLRRST